MIVLNKLIKADIFGRELMFEEHNVQAYKTFIGATLSIITFITVIIIGILFGREIYERKTPIVIESEELKNSTRINLRDYPLLINFRGDGVRTVDPHSLFDLSVIVLHMSPTNQFRPTSITSGLRALNKCDPKNYTYAQEFVNASLLQAASDKDYVYCMNHTDEHFFQNQYNTPNSTFIALYVSHCNEEARSKNKNLPKCIPKEQRLKLLEESYLRVDFLNVYLSPNDFHEPITRFKDSLTFELNTSMTKQAKVMFVKNLQQSDNGWMIQDIKQTEYIALKTYSEIITGFGENSHLFTLILESSPIRKKTQRNYMKVQDLFAKIGGLFNACVMIANLILYDYIRFKFRVNYFSFISSFNKSSLEHSGLVKINSSVSRDFCITDNSKRDKTDKDEYYKFDTNERNKNNEVNNNKQPENAVQLNNQSVAPLLSTQNNLNNLSQLNPNKDNESRAIEYLEFPKSTNLISNKNNKAQVINNGNLNTNSIMNKTTNSKTKINDARLNTNESKSYPNPNTNTNQENISNKLVKSDKLNKGPTMKDNYLIKENFNKNKKLSTQFTIKN